ncbi:MAG: hypothetical protein JWR72_3783 [Flavisolibacter sp.]|jgi:catechol-2,3-dioxygenase|nr:hypothetical protein [Flavisolibacter sp.]
MKIRLHEIEFGSNDVKQSTLFYRSVLGLQTTVIQDHLSVFSSGNEALDLNLSSHLPKGIAAVSFITDDLEEIIKRLEEGRISFDGPSSSHLGMTSIQFKDPDGYLIKVNAVGAESPEWLKV